MKPVVRAPSFSISGDDSVSEISEPMAAPISTSPSWASLTPSASWMSGRREYIAPVISENRKKQAASRWCCWSDIDQSKADGPPTPRGWVLRPATAAPASCRAPRREEAEDHQRQRRRRTTSGCPSSWAMKPSSGGPRRKIDERVLRQRRDIDHRRPVGALRRRRHGEREDRAGADADRARSRPAIGSDRARRTPSACRRTGCPAATRATAVGE